MSYHVTESQNNYYGTIVIKLTNISGLEQNKKYDYIVLRNDGNGSYKGYASFDMHNDELVLIDSSFTLPNNPPPYEVNSIIEIMDPQTGQLVLNTGISDIVDYGVKPIFNYDDRQVETTTSNISENLKEGIVINYDSDFSAAVDMVEQNVNQVIQSTDSLPSWAENSNIYNPPEMEPIELYTPPDWQQDPNMDMIGVDDAEEVVMQSMGMGAPPITDSDSGIAIINFDNTQQWLSDVDSYTHPITQNLEIVIVGDNNQVTIPYSEIDTSPYYQFSQFVQLEVTQLLGELTIPYRITTEPSSAIKILMAETNGGDAKFRISLRYSSTIGELLDSLEGVDVTLPSFFINNNNLNKMVNSETYEFETETIDVVGNMTDEQDAPIEELEIDEDGIKRNIREAIFELIYDNFIPDLNVEELNDLQQTIRDGQLTINRGDDELLVFTKKDGNVLQQMGVDENPGDEITNKGGLVDELYIQLSMDGTDDSIFTDYQYLKSSLSQLLNFGNAGTRWFIQFLGNEYRYATKDGEGNWINVPNIPNLTKTILGVSIDKDKAKKILDTDIFELLPPQYDRQEDIDGLFSERLITGNFLGEVPEFGEDGLISESELANDSGSRISETISDDAAITRLDNQANDDNQGKTIETLRNTLNQYLKDVDNVVEEIDDERPEYQNKSEGFLKLRKPNQAIIIRSFDDGELDFQKNNSYLNEGFTITMWVRFVGRTGNGTLFSYGNPYKADVENRYGFRLETFTINKNDDTLGNFDEQTEGIFTAEEIQPFGYSDYERFVRLVVWDNQEGEDKLYDSHFETDKYERQIEYDLPIYFPKSIYGDQGHDDGVILPAFNYTRIPTDNLDEWFFICATYNPEADMEVEDRAKVEMISRRDLLTARGFKVEEAMEEEEQQGDAPIAEFTFDYIIPMDLQNDIAL